LKNVNALPITLLIFMFLNIFVHLHSIYVCTGSGSISIHTDKKENKIFLVYKEIQMGSGAKS
jgi:hypothetical protein